MSPLDNFSSLPQRGQDSSTSDVSHYLEFSPKAFLDTRFYSCWNLLTDNQNWAEIAGTHPLWRHMQIGSQDKGKGVRTEKQEVKRQCSRGEIRGMKTWDKSRKWRMSPKHPLSATRRDEVWVATAGSPNWPFPWLLNQKRSHVKQ